jgi:predicted nucleic acid-binding Zn ribbon protein
MKATKNSSNIHHIQEGKHNCSHCGKEIQYVTSSGQQYCSNTCRSRANQLRRAQLIKMQREKNTGTQATDGLSGTFEQPHSLPPAEGMSVEYLCGLLESVLGELAEEKAKNTLMERELGRFKKVAWNVYVTQ